MRPSSSTSRTSPSPKPPQKLYDIREAPSYSTNANSNSDFEPTYKYNGEIAIVIDNGSWQTRAGFSHDPTPRFKCPPLVARYRDRKVGRTYTICGSDVFADATSRAQAKSPFDSNVVSNFDTMETLLDYCFIKLGIDGNNGGLGHPLVMTEAVCNPSYNRRMMTELIFEGYNAPALTYGIDSLFSYYYNGGENGLVISSGNSSTHVIPFINGRGLIPLTTRLNWGGSQSSDYLLKLLQLKYLSFPSKMQSWQAEAIMMEHCYISGDYKEEVSHYLEPAVLEEKDRAIQFPFVETLKVEKSQEELDRIAERRKESGRKLQEQAAKARLEKLIKKEQELEFFKDLQSRAETESKRDFKRLLESNDFRDEQHLEKTIRDLEKTIRRARKQDVGDEEENEGPPSFPLLDIPDEDLDEESKKQKRHQKLMKSNYDARQRAKAEKDAEKRRIEEEERRDVESRERDLETWVAGRRAARDTLLTKIKDRKRLKAELSDRKSLASQMRMKSIANLASDTPTSKKRRRGAGAADDGDDNFGANDDDWSVYRAIGTGGGDEEDEEEEEMNKDLKSIEAQLLLHDPNFEEHHTHEAQSDWSNSLLHAFLHGTTPFDPDSQAEAHQMHINIERIRVPEVVFQPSMAGLDQAGIVEIAADIVMHRISNPDEREKVLRDIFLTGGNAMFKGFEERLATELRAVLPAGCQLGVRKASDPLLDAWKGAAKWCKDADKDAEWRRAVVTREEYLEKGADYFKEHRLGSALV
ncbi:Actin-related protein 5 [Rhizina undulata]